MRRAILLFASMAAALVFVAGVAYAATRNCGDGGGGCKGTGMADLIYGGGGDDLIRAGDGDDRVHGRDGEDRIFGRDGADVIKGDQGDDEVYGEKGKDTVKGGLGSDLVVGGSGDDVLRAARVSQTNDGVPDVLDWRSRQGHRLLRPRTRRDQRLRNTQTF